MDQRTKSIIATLILIFLAMVMGILLLLLTR